ncbi:MAG: DUF1549 and DUF1553 domain-containing protein [Verrucomicrobia bacterium]|nr:DUF1549 and DUF1553 domain-containing protein [Verrucomicrobiota bacterium]
MDRFILSKLELEGLRPVPDADKTTLIRRVYYDLIGLPPKPEEIDAFLIDRSSEAFQTVVDRLLRSPHFGERWGRHWLDVVRFAESVTLRGLVFGEAWRYRDYVVEAFNLDLPYDQFVREQVSGDLMQSDSLEEKQRRLIATTFLTLGNTNLEDQDKAQLRMDVVDEQLDTIGKAFMAQTFGCARCHDHKFDPIPARDYYAMAGILRNTVTLIDDNVSNWIEIPMPLEPDLEKDLSEHEANVAKVQSELQAAKKTVAKLSSDKKESSSPAQQSPNSTGDSQGAILDDTPPKSETLKEALARKERLEAQLKALNTSGPKRPMVMSVKEDESISDTKVHVRGNVHSLGADVPRGVLTVATHGMPPEIPESESGRLQFGDWLASRSNPLTARVFANRVWQWLFGSGIVRTPDNFGHMGQKPSHPELLDFLALSFIENGWSIKSLIREIVLSHTYQLASVEGAASLDTASSASHSNRNPFEAGVLSDPENRFFWRMNRRRLDAECIRDSILFVSGELTLGMGGNTIRAGTKSDYGYTDTDSRRSLYIPVFRNALPELFEAFDFADPSMVTGRRNASTVAPQALFLLNHPFVMEQAAKTATRILSESKETEARIHSAYRRILGRSPTEAEQTQAAGFLNLGDEGSTGHNLEIWTEFIQALFASIDFRYLN